MEFQWIYVPWIIGTLIATYFLYRALKRIVKGIISYRKLGKEEFKKRLKEGFESITPTQKSKGELRGLWIMQLGLLVGVIVTPIVRITGFWYWIEILLIGSFVLNGFGLLGKWQVYQIQKKQDEVMKSLDLTREEQNVNE